MDSKQLCRAVQDVLQCDGVVKIELRSETEAVTQRPRQETGTRGRPNQREARNFQRDRGRSRPFADNNIDPEVLHRDIEHFLGWAGHSVDLIEEEDLSFDKPGQNRGQVAGMLNGRTA